VPFLIFGSSTLYRKSFILSWTLNKEARNPGELKMPSSCTPYNKEAKKPGN
jgi:hypothetical protein